MKTNFKINFMKKLKPSTEKIIDSVFSKYEAVNYGPDHDEKVFKENEEKLKEVLKEVCTTECTLLDVIPNQKDIFLTYRQVFEFFDQEVSLKIHFFKKVYKDNIKINIDRGILRFTEDVKKVREHIEWCIENKSLTKETPDSALEFFRHFLKNSDLLYLCDEVIEFSQEDNDEFDYLYKEDEQIQAELERKTTEILKEICTDTCTILDLIK